VVKAELGHARHSTWRHTTTAFVIVWSFGRTATQEET